MGVFDQASRYAARADRGVVPQRLLEKSGLTLVSGGWFDTRALPLPGGPDRTADLVAILQDSSHPDKPWLMVLEFQAREDVDKLDVTLEEVAILRSRARHGPDGKGKYHVVAGLVYLCGLCPAGVLDMRPPNGQGTRHEALVWNVQEDVAIDFVEAVAGGKYSWGMLFWVVLMKGGGDETLIARWKEVVLAVVADRQRRGDLVRIVEVFAELAGCLPAWERGLEGFDMTESEVVNRWISKGELNRARFSLLEALEGRFPGQASEEILQMIREQESLPLLDTWFRAVVRVRTFEDFLEVLRK